MSLGACPIGSFPIGATTPSPFALSGPQPAGGIDWQRWAAPPEGHRSILDTSGIDLRAQEQARLAGLRREIGLVPDVAPESPPVPVEPVIQIDAHIEARIEIPAEPEPPPYDDSALRQRVLRQIIEENDRGLIEEQARRTRRQTEDDTVILLLTALI